MKVFLLKDVEKIGLAGEILNVGDGFARNYLIPRKLAKIVTRKNAAEFEKIKKTVTARSKVIATETSMKAEKIRSIKITLKRKMHFEENAQKGKLYGSVNAKEIVDLLAAQGIKVSKSQISFDKSIKTQGTYEVPINLSSRLSTKVTLKVVSE